MFFFVTIIPFDHFQMKNWIHRMPIASESTVMMAVVGQKIIASGRGAG
jgi:hypothetical protein